MFVIGSNTIQSSQSVFFPYQNDNGCSQTFSCNAQQHEERPGYARLGIFAILHLTYYVSWHVKSFSGILDSTVVWLLERSHGSLVSCLVIKLHLFLISGLQQEGHIPNYWSLQTITVIHWHILYQLNVNQATFLFNQRTLIRTPAARTLISRGVSALKIE